MEWERRQARGDDNNIGPIVILAPIGPTPQRRSHTDSKGLGMARTTGTDNKRIR
jgi:hypothetical protein